MSLVPTDPQPLQAQPLASLKVSTKEVVDEALPHELTEEGEKVSALVVVDVNSFKKQQARGMRGLRPQQLETRRSSWR